MVSSSRCLSYKHCCQGFPPSFGCFPRAVCLPSRPRGTITARYDSVFAFHGPAGTLQQHLFFSTSTKAPRTSSLLRVPIGFPNGSLSQQSPLDVVGEETRRLLNFALASLGSPVEVRRIDGGPPPKVPAAQPPADDGNLAPGHLELQASTSSQTQDSIFWEPRQPGAPFAGNRNAFILENLKRSRQSNAVVPNQQIERYVDILMTDEILSGIPLPGQQVGRLFYEKLVRILLRVIHTSCVMLDGTEIFGRTLALLQQKSKRSTLHNSKHLPLNQQVIRRLANRVLVDHEKEESLNLPGHLMLRLYENIVALVFRLVLDVLLTVEVRCLGHSLKLNITADDMIETAPGWDIALEEGAFGVFDDASKRQWASSFVEDLLKDPSISLDLPVVMQKPLLQRVTLLLLNLVETAANHTRIHVAGVSLRPALLPDSKQLPPTSLTEPDLLTELVTSSGQTSVFHESRAKRTLERASKVPPDRRAAFYKSLEALLREHEV